MRYPSVHGVQSLRRREAGGSTNPGVTSPVRTLSAGPQTVSGMEGWGRWEMGVGMGVGTGINGIDTDIDIVAAGSVMDQHEGQGPESEPELLSSTCQSQRA